MYPECVGVLQGEKSIYFFNQISYARTDSQRFQDSFLSTLTSLSVEYRSDGIGWINMNHVGYDQTLL